MQPAHDISLREQPNKEPYFLSPDQERPAFMPSLCMGTACGDNAISQVLHCPSTVIMDSLDCELKLQEVFSASSRSFCTPARACGYGTRQSEFELWESQRKLHNNCSWTVHTWCANQGTELCLQIHMSNGNNEQWRQ